MIMHPQILITFFQSARSLSKLKKYVLKPRKKCTCAMLKKAKAAHRC
jgi:hypothetical protein